MAGQRHHFIQQALMRGFSNKSLKVFMYRKPNLRAMPVAINKIGVERLFYGSETENVDRTITDYENTVHFMFNDVSKALLNNKKSVIKYVYITLMRTRNFRMSTDLLIQNSFDGMFFALNSVDSVESLVKTIKNKPQIIEEALYDELVGKGYDPETTEFISIYKKLLFLSFLYGERLIRARSESITDFYRNFALDFRHGEHCIGSNAQKRALVKIINEDSFAIKYLNSITWRVVTFQSDLILGDSPVIMIADNGNYGIFHERIDTVANIVMPFNKNQALVGSKNKNFQIGADELNTMSASISYEYFISATDEFDDFVNYIGLESGIKHSIDFKETALHAFL